MLIKKSSGPYAGKLDLPGGTIEFEERPEDTLKRELIEEVGININKYELFDVDSVAFSWNYKDMFIKCHHVGIFFKVLDYLGEVKSKIELDNQNEDSMGAEFYDINKLSKKQLSLIAILELEKLGFALK